MTVRITMVGEGTYPVTRGGVSTWYRQLIVGMPEHRFNVVTLVGDKAKAAEAVPKNVDSVTLIPVWPRPPRPRIGSLRRHSTMLDTTLDMIWAGALPASSDTDFDLAGFRAGIHQLTEFSGQPLAGLFGRHTSAERLLAVWQAHAETRPHLPPMTMADAAAAAQHTDRILALGDRRLGPCDLIHLTANGGAALLAIAHKWRHGTPVILTEHGVYLRERYLAMRTLELSWTARCAVMAMVRAVCRLAYAEANLITPVSHFNAAWAADLGAPRERIMPLYNGVDVNRYPALASEPKEPIVTWVGRVDPLKDLATLINAFDLVRRNHPKARLRLFGPTPPENIAYRMGLERRIENLALGDHVTFEGPVESSSVAFQAGQVVVLSSISEGLPFSVIEAMMSARPSVNTDVGGVAEIIGRDEAAGLLVPPRDPEALASGLSRLLADGRRRAQMAHVARARATDAFTLSGCIDRHRRIYSGLVQGLERPIDRHVELPRHGSANATPTYSAWGATS